MNVHITFPGKEPNEKILLVLRRHWYVVFRRVVAFAASALLPGVILFAASITGHPFVVDPRELLPVLAVLGIATYELAVWVAFYVSWLDYELDLFIITDMRIVNIAQNGLFNRSISEQKLTRVQDVTSEVKGVIPTLMRFGNVLVQTAGEQEHFVFRNVGNPEMIAKVILQQIDRLEAERGIDSGLGVATSSTPRPAPPLPVAPSVVATPPAPTVNK